MHVVVKFDMEEKGQKHFLLVRKPMGVFIIDGLSLCSDYKEKVVGQNLS